MQGLIPSLNGLRALSIGMVLASHLQGHGFLPDSAFLKYLGFVLFNGPLGVSVFFIISGFLITTLLIKEYEYAKHQAIDLNKFYIRRSIRIFPAYYFLLLVYFLLQTLGYLEIKTTDWVASLTYTKQFLIFDGTSYETHHFWSLSVEEFFYLIWPFAFIKCKNQSGLVAVAGIILVVGLRMVNYQHPMPQWNNSIFSTGDALLIGCLIAIKRKKIEHICLLYRHIVVVLLLGIALSVLSYNYLFHLVAVAPTSEGNSFGYQVGMRLAYGLLGSVGLVTNGLIGILVVASISLKNSWSKLLNLPALEYIGKLSYSLYLWQQLFTADRELLHTLPLPVLLLLIFCVAIFSYHFIEKPFLSLKQRFAPSENAPLQLEPKVRASL